VVAIQIDPTNGKRRKRIVLTVMAALVAAIHVFALQRISGRENYPLISPLEIWRRRDLLQDPAPAAKLPA